MTPRLAALALSLAAFCGAAPAGAQSADVTLTDLGDALGPLTYRIPKVVIRGPGASPDTLSRILGQGSPGTRSERVRGLAANEILVPELVAATGPSDGRTTLTYRDIRLAGIKDGRAAAVTIGSTAFSATLPDGTVTGSIGGVAAETVDLALAASLGEPGTGTAIRPLYGAVTLKHVRITDPRGMTLRLDRVASRDVGVRPLASGWGAVVAALSAQTEPVRDPRPAALLAELAGSIAFGSIDAEGFAVELPGPARETARIGRIGSAQGSGALNLERVEIDGDAGRLSVAKVTLGGLGATQGAVAVGGLMPSSGSLRLESVALATPDRQVVSIGAVEVALVGGSTSTPRQAPVSLAFAARDAAMPLRPDDPAMKPLIDLGYSDLGGSLDGTGRYDEAREELTVDGVRLHVDGMGEVRIGIILGQVPPDVFRQDARLVAIGLLGARAKRLDVTIENGGLAERLVDRQARLSGAAPADLRRQYGAVAALGIPLVLGESQAARTLGEAGVHFVETSGRLAITLTAKDPAGLSVADLLTNSDPRTILDRVEVAAAP